MAFKLLVLAAVVLSVQGSPLRLFVPATSSSSEETAPQVHILPFNGGITGGMLGGVRPQVGCPLTMLLGEILPLIANEIKAQTAPFRPGTTKPAPIPPIRQGPGLPTPPGKPATKPATKPAPIPPAKKGLDQPTPTEASPSIRKVIDRSREEFKHGISVGGISREKADEIFDYNVAHAKNNELSILSKADVFLDVMVEDKLIPDELTKARISLNAFANNIHRNPPSDLRILIAQVIDAAVKAKIIGAEAGEKIKAAAPADIDVEDTPIARSVLDAPTPSNATPVIQKIIERGREGFKRAIAAGYITKERAEEVFGYDLSYAKNNEVSVLMKADVFLDIMIQENLIDFPTKGKISLNAFANNLHKNPSSDLKVVIAGMVDAAVKAGIIDARTGAKIKIATPSDLDVNDTPIAKTVQ